MEILCKLAEAKICGDDLRKKFKQFKYFMDFNIMQQKLRGKA